MGVYDSGINFDVAMGFGRDRLKPFALGALALLVLVLAAYWAVLTFDSGPVSIEFKKNPVKAGETAEVTVVVRNPLETDAENAGVSLAIKERNEFDVFPKNESFRGTISLLSRNTSREITYFVNPVGTPLPGTYTLVARFSMNGTSYEKEEKLVVEG